MSSSYSTEGEVQGFPLASGPQLLDGPRFGSGGAVGGSSQIPVLTWSFNVIVLVEIIPSSKD